MGLEVDQKYTALLNVIKLVRQDQHNRGVIMACSSYCDRFKTTVSQRMRYTSDRKHCTPCAVWVPSEHFRCPCCSTMLRTKKRLRSDTYQERKLRKELELINE